MALEENIFFWFLTKLEQQGLHINPEIALALQKIFQVKNITTLRDLKENNHLIVAVVAKNEYDVILVRRLFELFVLPGNQDYFRYLKEENYGSKRPFWLELELLAKHNRRRLLVPIAILSAIVLLGGWWFSPGRSNKKADDVTFEKTEHFHQKIATFRLSVPQRSNVLYKWNFGDNTTIKATFSTVVQHQYQKDGIYLLTVTKGTGRSQKRILQKFVEVQSETLKNNRLSSPQASGQVAGARPDYSGNITGAQTLTRTKIIPLKSMPLLQQTGYAVETETYYYWLRIGVYLVVLAFLCTVVYYFRFSKRIIKKHFSLEINNKPPFRDKLRNQGILFPSEMIDEIAYYMQFKKTSSSAVFDVEASIEKTIKNLGFPSLHYSEENFSGRYLALIEINPAQPLISLTIETLIKELSIARINITALYFNAAFDFFLGSEYPSGVSRGKVLEQFSTDRLIIYSSGYCFIDDYNASGFTKPAYDFLKNWQEKWLISTIPRCNWSSPEKRLMDFFKIYPLDLAGHLTFAKDCWSRQYTFSERSGGYIPMLSSLSIASYRDLFEKKLASPYLFTWVLCLALPDDIDGQVILFIGKCIEGFYSLVPSSVVSYDHLLQLNFVGWVRSYNLPLTHRMALIESLKSLPESERLKEYIYSALILEYKSSPVPDRSAAQVIRNIRITSLTYKLKRNFSLAEKSYIQQLNDEGRFDAYTSSLIQYERKISITKNYSIFFYVLMAGIIATLIWGAFFEGSQRFQIFSTTTIVTDSASYFNNKAVAGIGSGPAISNLPQLKGLLYQSVDYNIKNDTALYNIYALNYKEAVYDYNHELFPNAFAIFNQIVENNDLMRYNQLLEAKNGLESESLIRRGLKLRLYKLLKQAYYNKQLCQYYLQKTSQNDPGYLNPVTATLPDSTRAFNEFDRLYWYLR